jgi:hypothetical protein
MAQGLRSAVALVSAHVLDDYHCVTRLVGGGKSSSFYLGLEARSRLWGEPDLKPTQGLAA